jgi:hypothetical protein
LAPLEASARTEGGGAPAAPEAEALPAGEAATWITIGVISKMSAGQNKPIALIPKATTTITAHTQTRIFRQIGNAVQPLETSHGTRRGSSSRSVPLSGRRTITA